MNLQDVAWGSMLKQSDGSGGSGSGSVDTAAVAAAVTPVVKSQVQRDLQPVVQQTATAAAQQAVQAYDTQLQQGLSTTVTAKVQESLQQRLPAEFLALKAGLKPADLYSEWQTGLLVPSASNSTTGQVANNAVFRVVFDAPFKQVPQVWYSAISLGTSRLERVQNITTTGFEYSCSYSPATDNVVQWVAFVPKP